MQIVGVGFGSLANNAEWALDQGFQYEVWSDADRILAVAYGAASDHGALWPDRVSVLIDRDGSVVLQYSSDVSVTGHPEEVLQDCRLLFEGR